MAAIFFDGFDYYTPGITSALPLSSRWTLTEPGSTSGNITTVTGRYPNSQAMRVRSGSSGSTALAEIYMGQNLTNFSCGFSLKMSGTVTASNIVAFVSSVSSSVVLALRHNADLSITLLSGATEYGTTSANAIPLDAWVYVEIECSLSNSVGSTKAYINGAQVINAPSVAIPPVGDPTFGVLRFSTGGSVRYSDIDDLYVSNTATKLGESRVIVISPSSDTVQKNFQTSPATGLAGNYDAVNGLTVDNTDWIYGGTTGWKDIYEVADMPFNPAEIHGIQPIYVARKDDAADMNVRVNLISGASTITGPTNNLLNSTTNWYSYYNPIIYNNPISGLPWKANDINNLKMGPEIL